MARGGQDTSVNLVTGAGEPNGTSIQGKIPIVMPVEPTKIPSESPTALAQEPASSETSESSGVVPKGESSQPQGQQPKKVESKGEISPPSSRSSLSSSPDTKNPEDIDLGPEIVSSYKGKEFQLSCSPERVLTAKRRLWEVDSKGVEESLSKELKRIHQEESLVKSARWNFDFERDAPLPGNWRWEEIESTPQFYQSKEYPKKKWSHARFSPYDRPGATSRQSVSTCSASLVTCSQEALPLEGYFGVSSSSSSLSSAEAKASSSSICSSSSSNSNNNSKSSNNSSKSDLPTKGIWTPSQVSEEKQEVCSSGISSSVAVSGGSPSSGVASPTTTVLISPASTASSCTATQTSPAQSCSSFVQSSSLVTSSSTTTQGNSSSGTSSCSSSSNNSNTRISYEVEPSSINKSKEGGIATSQFYQKDPNPTSMEGTTPNPDSEPVNLSTITSSVVATIEPAAATSSTKPSTTSTSKTDTPTKSTDRKRPRTSSESSADQSSSPSPLLKYYR